jgi:hypothetical protein
MPPDHTPRPINFSKADFTLEDGFRRPELPLAYLLLEYLTSDSDLSLLFFPPTSIAEKCHRLRKTICSRAEYRGFTAE